MSIGLVPTELDGTVRAPIDLTSIDPVSIYRALFDLTPTEPTGRDQTLVGLTSVGQAFRIELVIATVA